MVYLQQTGGRDLDLQSKICMLNEHMDLSFAVALLPRNKKAHYLFGTAAGLSEYVLYCTETEIRALTDGLLRRRQLVLLL